MTAWFRLTQVYMIILLFILETINIVHKRSSNDDDNDNEHNFYFGIPTQSTATESLTIKVSITASITSVNYKMKKHSGTVSGEVKANATTDITLAHSDVVQDQSYEYRGRGIHLNATGSVLVLVTIHNEPNSVNGEFPVFPHQSLELDEYVYYAVSTGSKQMDERGFILIVATNMPTTVTIVPTVNVTMPSNVEYYSSYPFTCRWHSLHV